MPDDDDLRRVIVDARTQCESQKEKLKFDRMLEDHKKGLYPNCEDGNTKLGTVLELLQWKAENVVPDKGFEKLLKIMKKKLPKDNELPGSTYAAKKVVCPLGLEVEKIHACPNDSMPMAEGDDQPSELDASASSSSSSSGESGHSASSTGE